MQIMRRQDAWSPFKELQEISSRMNRLFAMDRWPLDGDGDLLTASDWWPACDVSETDKEYRIRADLPSVDKDDIRVSLENGVLTIEGERREEREEKNVRFHRRELSYGKFSRRFSIPSDADESKVDASFREGALNVVIGKSTQRPTRTKTIKVN